MTGRQVDVVRISPPWGSPFVDVPDGSNIRIDPPGDDGLCRGSLLFYDGKALHGGGANNSDGVRQGVNITNAVGWGARR